MKLFDDNLRTVAQAHADASDDTLLGFWHLVFSDLHESYRNSLENFFSKLEKNAQDKIKSKILTDNKGFYETLNEMVVGGILADRGWALQYEPRFNRKTPDWLIHNSENQKLVVDVLTLRTPLYMSKQYEVFYKLEEKVRDIEYGIILNVKIEDAYLADNNIDEIVNDLARWISLKPKIGDFLSSNGSNFTIQEMGKDKHRKTILSGQIDDSRRNDFRDLPGKIIEKACNYENISKIDKIPFVVAIVLDRILVSEDTIEQIICTSGFSYVETRHFQDQNGNWYTRKYVPDGIGGLVELEERFDEGVFRKDSLSGVFTIWFLSRQFIHLIPYRNPKATIPLPENVI